MTVVINGSLGITDVDGTASAPALTGTDTDTGTFFPAANTMAFSTGGTEAVRIDSSGNLQFNSGYGSVATAYGCRAWVNFNGTGTVAIRGSGNVSSITDNGTGDYTVNFTTAFVDANYAPVLGSERTGANDTGNVCFQSVATGSISISTFPYNSATRVDVAVVTVSIFR